MNFCPYCGEKLNDGHKFCGKCGRQVDEGEKMPDPASGTTPDDSEGLQPDTNATALSPEKPVRHIGLLKLLSVLFVLGMIVGALGIGGKLFFNRFYAYHHQNFKKSLSTENDFMIIFRNDAEGYKKETGNKVNNKYITHTVAELNEFDGDFDKLARDDLKRLNERMERMAGTFRYILLKLGAYSTLLMAIGFGLALLTLILWFALGGISAGFIKSGMMASFIVSGVLVIAAILVGITVDCIWLK